MSGSGSNTGTATGGTGYRVTSAEVLEIFGAPPDVTDLTPFIRVANLMVNTHLSGKGLSSSLLKEIELYLAAHFACMRYRQFSSESIGPASRSYADKALAGTGFQITRYGQQALALDPLGILNTLSSGSRHTPSIQVLGDDVADYQT